MSSLSSLSRDGANGRVPSPLPPPAASATAPSSASSAAAVAASSPAAILASWSPAPAELQLVFTLLSDPLPGAAASQSHYAQLQQLKAYPEFSNYLAYILACCKAEPATTRAKAGLQLKNTVKEQWERMSGAQQEYIKAAVVESMAAEKGLHHVVGTIIANIAVRCRIVGWPGILQHLIAALDAQDANLQTVAFNAVSKICEDAGKELIKDDGALGKPLHYLIPKLITFFHHPKPELRVYALSAVNVFLYLMPLVMRMHLDSFLQAVFVLAKSDDNKEVRKRVCQAFVLLLENKNGHDKPLQPHMDGVINFMLHACNDSDDSVALEASEFWSAYCDIRGDASSSSGSLQHNGDIQLLATYLQPLTATLLKGMRYSEDDIEADDDDDANVPDRQQDIRPNVHRGKTVNYEGAAAGGGGGGGAAAAAHDGSAGAGGGDAAADSSWGGNEYDDDEDDEDDDDDDDFFDEEDDEEVQNWNLRKCSASALDSLANTYGPLLFAHLLPLLKVLLSPNPSPAVSTAAPNKPAPEQWILRESAILALGAVAEGSFEAIMPHLPELIPYLLSSLTDKKPLVRSITCWTLSRYSKWVVTEPQQAFFQPLLEGLLNSILDSNKKVQEAACSAFATFEEEAGLHLSAHLPRILQFLMHAFSKYQQKNMLILYDAIGTLAESVGDMLNQPQCVSLLMPPLMQRWHQLTDEDRAIFPLFECLGSLATSLGEGFLPYAAPVFQRCLHIIQRSVEEQKAVEQRNQQEQAKGAAADYGYVDLEFVVCALDLLSGLTEGLGHLIEPLIPQSPVMPLLYQCFTQSHTRILTAHGFLFYDDIKTRFESGQPVLFACYDVASEALVYRSGELVEPPAPAYLVDFNSSDEAHRWQAASGSLSKDAAICWDNEQPCSSHVSLRVTAEHRMYVQPGSADDRGKFVPFSKNRTPKSSSVITASDLLSCDCPTSACLHRTSHIRFTAYAAAGHSPSLPSLNDRTRIRQQLQLSDTQFIVFLELLGYWLLMGELDHLERTVCFRTLRDSDTHWLRDMLAAAGLPHEQSSFSRCDAMGCAVVRSPSWFAHFAAEFGANSANEDSEIFVPHVGTASPTASCNSSDTRDSRLSDSCSEDESSFEDGSNVGSVARAVKRVPYWIVMSLAAVDLKPLIRGIRRACSLSPPLPNGATAQCIHTSDPRFRDQLLQLLLHAGHAAFARCVHSHSELWAVEWTSAVDDNGTADLMGHSSCMPQVARAAGGVTRVPYSAERDGRVWCVRVDHPDHLIVAQRAEQHNSRLTQMSRPVVVGQCMSDHNPDVRQSAFALLGDLSKAACSHLLPFLGYFLPLCAVNLNPHHSSVCNNASWAVGELAIKAGREPLLPHVEPLMQYLILILCPLPQPNGGSGAYQHTVHSQSQRVSASLLENASITIGRLGLVCPQPVSQRLAEYAGVWFAQLERLRDNAEKEHAYHGLCSVVESNPTAVLSDLPALLSVVCGWRQLGNERMVARLRSLLHNFKQAFEGQGERGVQQWNSALAAVSDDKRRLLHISFGV